MKKFTPKNASLTKKQIWSFFYEYQTDEKMYMSYGIDQDDWNDNDGLVKKPAYTANEIPNRLCQEFVDEELKLHDDFDSEEDLVDARVDLVRYFHSRILHALKRK